MTSRTRRVSPRAHRLRARSRRSAGPRPLRFPHSLGAAPDAGGGGTTGAAGSTSGTAGRGGAGGAVTGLGGAAGAGGGAAGAGGGAAGAGGGAAGVGGRPACSDAVPCGRIFLQTRPVQRLRRGDSGRSLLRARALPRERRSRVRLRQEDVLQHLRSDQLRRGPDPSNACFGSGGSGGNGGRGGGGGGGTAGGGGSAGGTRGATSCAGLQPFDAILREHHGRRLRHRHPFHGVLTAPAACGATPTCACLATVACSTICSTIEGGILAVVCQAP